MEFVFLKKAEGRGDRTGAQPGRLFRRGEETWGSWVSPHTARYAQHARALPSRASVLAPLVLTEHEAATLIPDIPRDFLIFTFRTSLPLICPNNGSFLARHLVVGIRPSGAPTSDISGTNVFITGQGRGLLPPCPDLWPQW